MTHSGFDKQRFVNMGFESFDCLICLQVVKDPMECSQCARLFCKVCIMDWSKKNPSSRCPQRCSANLITEIQSRALLKTYLALTIRCSNPKCGEVVKLGELEKHEQNCLKVKCWNHAVCSEFENEAIKGYKPCCSHLCRIVYELTTCYKDQEKVYGILQNFMGHNNLDSGLCWDTTNMGVGIVVSEANTHVFLKESAYVFRTIVGNIAFTCGINYFEIIADSRTENQLKIGVVSSKSFDFNSAFCDHSFGWAYYGLGQLRHGSNSTGAAYGKRFKKDGILGVLLNMNEGTLSFALNGQNMGVAYKDEKLKTGEYYPAVSLLHCAGCKIRGGVPIPSYFN